MTYAEEEIAAVKVKTSQRPMTERTLEGAASLPDAATSRSRSQAIHANVTASGV